LIETDRLTLRPLTVADLDDILALHEDEETIRFLGSLDHKEALERLTNNEREWRELGYGRLAIVERATGRFLGRGGLKYWPQFDESEVGWALRADRRGQGYATEAARASIDWGFATLDVPYITAMIEPANTSSRAVARRLGMEKLRDDVLEDHHVEVFAAQRPDAAV
jgi:RimJ/RimL family protein N-acetyltransferase